MEQLQRSVHADNNIQGAAGSSEWWQHLSNR
jgi:hypothetical protein